MLDILVSCVQNLDIRSILVQTIDTRPWLKLDRSLMQAISVEIYEFKTSRSDFWPMLKYLYKVSFLTTLDIYNPYLKGRHICRKCPSSLFSLKNLLCLYTKGFVTKEFLDLHHWWTEELCSQQPLQVARVSHILGFVHTS